MGSTDMLKYGRNFRGAGSFAAFPQSITGILVIENLFDEETEEAGGAEHFEPILSGAATCRCGRLEWLGRG